MDIFGIFLLIVLNGVFAMSEIAVISARRPRLQHWSKTGDLRATMALRLHDSPNVFLSTTQIGITLIGVLTGAVGEAAAAGRLADYFTTIPLTSRYAHGLALALVVVGITYVSLVVGELVPKRLGLRRPERIARAVAVPMWYLSRVAHPLVRLLSLSMEAVLTLLRVKQVSEPPVTEEEIKTLIEEGTRVGVFAKAEQELLKNVIRLADRTMGMLMRPRADIVWIDLDDTPEDNKRKIINSPHSRFPVTRGGLDNVLGVVQSKDVLAQLFSGQSLDFNAVTRPVLHVPETMSSLRLLEMLKTAPNQMALVVDEYGEILGLVTLNDILQAIVGTLSAGIGPAEPMIATRADGSWLVDGTLSIEELKELLNVAQLPGEREEHYETISGFALMQLGRIPSIGDRFAWERWQFEIVDMDGNRIDRVLVATTNKPDKTSAKE